jgi:methylenetetrahydrofolate reductase (NADPH)
MSNSERHPTLREMLTSGQFRYGAEIVATRGYTPADKPDKIVELGEVLANDPRIAWISITDNPGGNVMPSPDWLGRRLLGKRAQVVLHMTCKDMNRNALEATAWKYASEGFENILAMTGDYQISGYRGNASPVFDIDSVALVALLSGMNQGLRVPGRKGEIAVLPKTNFYIGCAVSPFKRYERELMPQYFKLLRKLACGAHFVYPQLGYDMRKFYEIKLLLQAHGINVPVIGNVYLLNKVVAGLFHRGEIPGCVVTDKLMEQVNKYAGGPDKGKSFFYDLAAKQLAVFKGMGFAAGYLGGMSKAETFFELIDRSQKFGENDWKEFAKELQYPYADEFYFFEQDPATGLGDPKRINRSYLESQENPPWTKYANLNYRVARIFYHLVFEKTSPFYNIMKVVSAWLDKHPGSIFKLFHLGEKLGKNVVFKCRDCGDCSLHDIANLCPMGSCSKNQRNGPCGGSRDGLCELEDKECIWAVAYERLKHSKEAGEMLRGPPIFCNAALRDTSAWVNYFTGRDHFGVAAEPAPAEKKTEKT